MLKANEITRGTKGMVKELIEREGVSIFDDRNKFMQLIAFELYDRFEDEDNDDTDSKHLIYQSSRMKLKTTKEIFDVVDYFIMKHQKALYRNKTQ